MTNLTRSRTPLVLMSTLAVQGALAAEVLPAFAAHLGANVEPVFDPTNVLIQRIAQGQRADVMIAVSACIEDLIAQGVLSPHGAREIVRTGIGVAVADGAPLPPLGTASDLRHALLDARSVAYSRTGVSGVYFAGLLERMGIAERINATATVIPKGLTGECIVRGEADLAIQQLSELAIVKGIRLAGPLPDEVQSHTCFSIAAFANPTRRPEAEALLNWLDAPLARSAYVRYGLECLDRSSSERPS
ncbi:substrate-binding domain-containing protein [Caballeronia sp. LZ065]|uniref:substrate-binding domain-containing protein n=1 Tax=Caballeronia sp. LZ065 TaxID=3038571 RepID=UPI002857F6E4|nr:substrate-binding domain-containing protein [Caballeronia sp. LZ065]MDR5781936.1 substrate-binding domain-containing protein [Caballeronia sp. LZ065]